MTSPFYSSSGARRGLVIAMAAICLWVGWAVGWLMSPSIATQNYFQIELKPITCKERGVKKHHLL
jgi:hypothetical protein